MVYRAINWMTPHVFCTNMACSLFFHCLAGVVMLSFLRAPVVIFGQNRDPGEPPDVSAWASQQIINEITKSLEDDTESILSIREKFRRIKNFSDNRAAHDAFCLSEFYLTDRNKDLALWKLKNFKRKTPSTALIIEIGELYYHLCDVAVEKIEASDNIFRVWIGFGSDWVRSESEVYDVRVERLKFELKRRKLAGEHVANDTSNQK